MRHDPRGAGSCPDRIEERLPDGAGIERSDPGMDREAELWSAVLRLRLDELIVDGAPPKRSGRTCSSTRTTSVSTKVMPPAVSFSKLRMVWRCVRHPSASIGQPHRRSVTVAQSPIDTLRSTNGTVGRIEETSNAPRGNGAASAWMRAFRSWKRWTSSGASGRRHP
jgi:hypothetical protein